jgi:D-xylonolactonase
VTAPNAREPELVVDEPCTVGEGPIYHPDDGRVYWVDIVPGRLYAYDPAADGYELIFESDAGRIGGVTIQADGALLLFGECGAVHRLDPLGDGPPSEAESLIDPDPDRFRERFNDVIADPEGRVFCGVMPDVDAGVPGELYRLDRDGTFTRVIDELDLPNGMGFTRDGTATYVTDTCEHADRPGYVDRYDYDRATGALRDPERFVTREREGFPDGLTVDADGGVWSAAWLGGELVRYTPDGERDRTVPFVPRKVSSITFGGDDYRDAYVTTAGGDDRATGGAGAGGLFRVELGVAGVPEFRSRIDG